MKSKNKQIRFKTLLAACVCIIALRASAGTFDFVVQTTTANQAFAFQTDNASGFNIDWGDGQTQTGLSGTALRSHNYAVPGVYTNKVAGTATRIAFGGTGTTPLLLRDILSPIDEGVTGINSTAYMFWGAENVERFTRADWFDTASTNVVNTMYMVNGMKKFNQDISGWDVSKSTSFFGMFREARAFNQDLSGWDTGNVTNMKEMFFNATAFNGNITTWDVGKVNDMNSTFKGASSFNQDISGWNVANVTTMQEMFNGAAAFDQDIGGWDVGKVTQTYSMFQSAGSFNQPIGDWAVSNVTRTSYMFYNAVNFNQDISGWDVGKVTQMDRMFYGAKTFNQPIGDWNVRNVTTMHGMFFRASAFNQPLGNWDLGKATTLYAMFYEATSFNQPIGDWNVRNVTTMQSMFDGATAFKQDLSGWTVSNVGNFANFLNRVTLPTDYYNSLLIRWSKQNLKTGVDFNGGSSQYDLGKPDVCRESMIDTFGWTIADGGSTGKWYAYEPGVISFQ